MLLTMVEKEKRRKYSGKFGVDLGRHTYQVKSSCVSNVTLDFFAPKNLELSIVTPYVPKAPQLCTPWSYD